MAKYFFKKRILSSCRIYSFCIIPFSVIGIPIADNLIYLVFLLLILLIILLVIKLYLNQKKLLATQNNLLNQRLINIEREYLKLRSDFSEQVKHNFFNEKLISFISHDLRSPMSALLNTSHIFNYYINKNDYRNLLKASSEIDLTIRNINNMLDNLLNWHHSNTGKVIKHPSLINICDVFTNCTELYAEYAKSKSIKINYRKNGDFFVYADFNMVQEAIKNILCNAIKYSLNNSSITISISKSENDAVIDISDEGVGIPEEVIRSFEKDARFNPIMGTRGEKGFGLGLSVSKKFISECGGRISLQNKIPEGTNVNIRLPLAMNN